MAKENLEELRRWQTSITVLDINSGNGARFYSSKQQQSHRAAFLRGDKSASLESRQVFCFAGS